MIKSFAPLLIIAVSDEMLKCGGGKTTKGKNGMQRIKRAGVGVCSLEEAHEHGTMLQVERFPLIHGMSPIISSCHMILYQEHVDQ